MTDRYEQVVERLRRSYDGGAAGRDSATKQDWKLAERATFRSRLASQGRPRLLEIGAGTGQDSVFFQHQGCEVVAVDLSPQMVARCRAKGIDARVADLMELDFPADSFDAVYAMNCLLHVPNADLPAVLRNISAAMRRDALFFLGVFGGDGHEGPLEHDDHVPPRFFSFRTDEQIQELVRDMFAIVDFHVVDTGEFLFQSLTVRPKPGPISG